MRPLKLALSLLILVLPKFSKATDQVCYQSLNLLSADFDQQAEKFSCKSPLNYFSDLFQSSDLGELGEKDKIYLSSQELKSLITSKPLSLWQLHFLQAITRSKDVQGKDLTRFEKSFIEARLDIKPFSQESLQESYPEPTLFFNGQRVDSKFLSSIKSDSQQGQWALISNDVPPQIHWGKWNPKIKERHNDHPRYDVACDSFKINASGVRILGPPCKTEEKNWFEKKPILVLSGITVGLVLLSVFSKHKLVLTF
jgi:hypothetical protein